jgi:aspartyl-tRNA(Asn)/glutamyl-tRNA(Gln) amidotransferase subunit A
MTISEAAGALRNGSISATELVDAALAQIARRNPQLNAFITVCSEAARKRARDIDRLRMRGDAYRKTCGPLCGIPFALKDVFCAKGVRTTCGSPIFAGYVPEFDSAVAARLEAAGAILIGKTGMHELAYGITSENPHFGTVQNPAAPGRIAGGSSGGSAAAVASDMVMAAMGTDTGGSIRIPASYCGIVGLKPTSGRVSRYGVLPLDFSLDHMGPLTRSVRDAAIVLNAIAGHDDRDDTSSRRPVVDFEPPPEPSLRGVRVGWPENFFLDRVDPEVAAAVQRASKLAEAAGAIIVPTRVPDIAAINAVGRTILLCEATAVFGRDLANRPEVFGEDVRLLLEQGALLPATAYINAQRLRRRMQAEFARLWTGIDVLLTPATPTAAPPLATPVISINGEIEDARAAATRFTRCFNVLGIPAISIPCGFTSDRFPIGLQLSAPGFEERRLLEIACATERELHL